MAFFKTEAKKTPQGNYNIATTCAKNHTGYKAPGGGEYKCPYCGLGMP